MTPNIFTKPSQRKAMPVLQPMAAMPSAYTQPKLMSMGCTIGVYQPQTPLSMATDMAALLTRAEVDYAMRHAESAAPALCMGHGTQAQYEVLCSAAVLAQAIDALGVVSGLRDHLSQISETLEAIATRTGATNTPPTWRSPALRSAEMDDVRLLVKLLRYQLTQLSYGEYQKATRRVAGWLRSEGKHLMLEYYSPGGVDLVGGGS